jgi:hypothetical protein
LDYALRGYDRRIPFGLPGIGPELANPEIIRAVVNQDIIIENSPPEAITFRALVAKAPGVAIGTLVGMRAVGDAHWLMMFTVPTGIIVCSSAIGISKALEKGLNKIVEKFITERRH